MYNVKLLYLLSGFLHCDYARALAKLIHSHFMTNTIQCVCNLSVDCEIICDPHMAYLVFHAAGNENGGYIVTLSTKLV
jgi:hypothetical protein